MKPNIIYFQQNLAIGACEEYFYLLMEGIDRAKFEVSFVCPSQAVLDTLVNKVTGLGIAVYRYPASNNYGYLQSLFREVKPGLIHFNDLCIKGIISGHMAGVPVLVMTHHTPELNRNYNFKGRVFEKIAFRYCRPYIIFTSEYDRETGIKKDKISKKRSFVIYYGLPPERFNQRYDKKDIYKEFSLNEECRIIGSIGRLVPQKGHSYLIEAALIVLEKYRNVKFFIVGEGGLELELKALVQKKGLQNYFVFTGYRSDIPKILSAFEIMVMPSLFEGLCFAVIEASAMGVPVIATKVGGMQCSVIDRKTGLLVPPRNPQALANAILWMLERPEEAKEMGQAGRNHFEELFTQGRMIEKTEELYEMLLTAK